MKRVIAFIMVFALMIACTGGCNKAPAEDGAAVEEEAKTNENSLQVLFDMGITRSPVLSEGDRDESLEEFKAASEELGGPRDISFEFIFYQYQGRTSGENSSLRDAELTRVRTELMAGGGPDVFITACENICTSIFGRPLFKYPDQVMKRHTFLTLDSYIENARFMEWDKLTPVVMEAGRTEEGQQVLPLTYTLPVAVCRKKDLKWDHSRELTFYDMAGGQSPVPIFSANIRDAEDKTGQFSVIMDEDRMAGLFTKVADYSTETLAFSEEDLLKVMKTIHELESSDKEREDVPDFFYTGLGVGFNQRLDMDPGRYAGIKGNEALSLIPVYSADGGYGAFITSFAAINRNTKRPEDAFFVLDYLLSKECQQSSIYMNATVGQSILTHEEVMCGKKHKVVSGTERFINPQNGKKDWARWYMGKSTFDELCELRDNITAARFNTELDAKLLSLLEKSKYYSGDGGSTAKEVHRAYMEMQMMLAES